nr:proline-rich protein 36-like isoform X1 [Megalopta genalis]
MKFLLLASCLLVTGLLTVEAVAGVEEAAGEKPEITKLELVDLGEGESDIDAKDTEVQRKRDSGYSYKRPGGGFAAATRARFQVGQSGHRGRIVNRHPAQINRPVMKYGPPGYPSQAGPRPSPQNQQHRDKLQFPGHFGQQHSGNFDNRPGGLQEQGVPSPIRQVDFVEPSPIASQNNEPFASHAANYLPPQNQKLPGYAQQQPFSPIQSPANNGPEQLVNFQSQSLVQPQPEFSDATVFLTQNAQAIQQLYGAPANEQDFAPNDAPFPGQTNQVPSPLGQFENFESSSQNPLGFPGALPSYASGTLSAQETLEQIQSLEKDRLIIQLQRALASQTQAQNADAAGRYAQNQPGFVQSQDLLASLGQRMKIHGLNAHPGTVTVGSGNTAFNQSPFLPGTTVGPVLPLNYGVSSTTTRPPPTSVTTSTTSTQPPQATKGDGTTPLGSVEPATTLSPTAAVPVYAGFVPTLISGTSFVSNVPTYGPGFFAPGAVGVVQPSGSSPTHFGLPIPTNPRPVLGSVPSTVTSSSPSTPSSSSTPSTSRPSVPSSPPVNPAPLPVHPIAAPLHPVVTQLHPVASLQPILPAVPAQAHHPVQSPPAAHPTYGIQSPVINPFLYKPVKPVYPLYYYPNVAYQLQKPAALPTYPWSYAPTYATQAKPAQIWK